MKNSSSNAVQAKHAEKGPGNGLILLLAFGAGLGVAPLYYNQPILAVLASEFGASNAAIGYIPTLTQVGYAIGILLLAPLGDRFDRRTVILSKIALLALALLAMAAAGSVMQLYGLSILVGGAASLAQDCVPAAAAVTPENRRGKTVGMVMTGLLLGILLSRVVSGSVSEWFGWRTMFVGAAAAMAGLWVVAWRSLPNFAASTSLPYGSLLGSTFRLWGQHASLRRAALAQGLLSAAFSAFWALLAVMLHAAPFNMGAAAAGAFGLAGAVGALAAPIAGGIADRRGPELVTRLGAALVLASFVAFILFPHNLWVLIAGVLIFDLGVQSSLIAHQTIIYSLAPEARSRLNALFIGIMFVGMATGSGVGAAAYAAGGWRGLCGFAAACAAAALVIRLWGSSARQPQLAKEGA